MIIDEEYWPDGERFSIEGLPLIKGFGSRAAGAGINTGKVFQAGEVINVHHTGGSGGAGYTSIGSTDPIPPGPLANWSVHELPDGQTAITNNGKTRLITYKEMLELQKELLEAVEEKRSIGKLP